MRWSLPAASAGTPPTASKLDKGDLKGYILLDNFCVVYGANNQDVTAPVVTSIQLVNDDGTKTELEDGMTLHSDKLRFRHL